MGTVTIPAADDADFREFEKGKSVNIRVIRGKKSLSALEWGTARLQLAKTAEIRFLQ
jgi:hypothetical protein